MWPAQAHARFVDHFVGELWQFLGLPVRDRPPCARLVDARVKARIEMRFGRLLGLACMALALACTGGTEGGTAGNTELNLDIVNPGGSSGELGFSIDRVDYRITCAGNPPGSYPITPADTAGTDYNYDDSVDISGAFEVVDTRDPPVWQAVMDLPPGDCTITLSVYEDDEVVCVGSQTLAIAEDATTKYDIVLVCSLSIDTPDGMADVDGEFFFITGNLCPKLYVLNAIPSVVDISTNPPVTEIQYRAKDPDNSCGNNCDPQSCTTDNPPVCTPYPSNINDPACNPAAGGDPNSVDCQAGVYAGLVCTIAAFPAASGVPGGNFLSPLDGVTPVGPVLPVNLNLASGVPGIILPGLGGPAGTNAANSPAYPPLPNVNGSLPPLRYRCDPTTPGQVVINLDCSDGDAECDQNKQLQLICPGIDYCLGVSCAASGQCLTDGACDFLCDPSTGCEQCVGQDLPVPSGTVCSEGGGNVCDGAGNCVECLADSDCADIPSTPVDCQLPNTCTGNSCVAGGTAPAGTPCSNGLCDGSGIGAGACQFDLCDPCDLDCGQVPNTCTNVLSLGCTNNVTSDISILPFQLEVNPDPIVANTSTSAVFGGIAAFSEVFLDAAQGAVPGGVTTADLVSLSATVQIRSGGTLDAPITLTNPPLPTTCLIGGGACDPANDGASVPGSQPNTDCVPTGSFNPCQALVSIPISSDCAPAGACAALGKLASQCDVNGFCVTTGLPLVLEDQVASFTPAASGIVNFGFADQGTGATVQPDGTYLLPPAVFTGPTQLNEIKVNASGLSVALVCTMAVDSGGPDGVGVPDQASPTPTSLLSTFNIQVP